MSKISNEAFIRASQNGTLDTYEKWVDSLLAKHSILTNHEFVNILEKAYGPDSEYGHIFSGTLAMMDTAGKLRKTDRICTVTGKPGSGYFKNPDYIPAKQSDFEYQRSLEAVPSAVKTYNKRADAVGQDRIKIILEKTVKDLNDLEWALRVNNFNAQKDAADLLKTILSTIV